MKQLVIALVANSLHAASLYFWNKADSNRLWRYECNLGTFLFCHRELITRTIGVAYLFLIFIFSIFELVTIQLYVKTELDAALSIAMLATVIGSIYFGASKNFQQHPITEEMRWYTNNHNTTGVVGIIRKELYRFRLLLTRCNLYDISEQILKPFKDFLSDFSKAILSKFMLELAHK